MIRKLLIWIAIFGYSCTPILCNSQTITLQQTPSSFESIAQAANAVQDEERSKEERVAAALKYLELGGWRNATRSSSVASVVSHISLLTRAAKLADEAGDLATTKTLTEAIGRALRLSLLEARCGQVGTQSPCDEPAVAEDLQRVVFDITEIAGETEDKASAVTIYSLGIQIADLGAKQKDYLQDLRFKRFRALQPLATAELDEKPKMGAHYTSELIRSGNELISTLPKDGELYFQVGAITFTVDIATDFRYSGGFLRAAPKASKLVTEILNSPFSARFLTDKESRRTLAEIAFGAFAVAYADSTEQRFETGRVAWTKLLEIGGHSDPVLTRQQILKSVTDGTTSGNRVGPVLLYMAGERAMANQETKNFAQNATPAMKGKLSMPTDMPEIWSGFDSPSGLLADAAIIAGGANEPGRAAFLTILLNSEALGGREKKAELDRTKAWDAIAQSSEEFYALEQLQIYANVIPERGALVLIINGSISGGIIVLTKSPAGRVLPNFQDAPRHNLLGAFVELIFDGYPESNRFVGTDAPKIGILTSYLLTGAIPIQGTNNQRQIDLLKAHSSATENSLGSPIRRALRAAGVVDGSSIVIVQSPMASAYPLAVSRINESQRWLVDSYRLSFATSLQSLSSRKDRLPDPGTSATVGSASLLLFGGDETGSGLRLTSAELKVVRVTTNASTSAEFVGDFVTFGSPQGLIWHMTSHGVYNPGDPNLSGLKLSETRLLTIPEISNLRLTNPPKLVFLSACDSALVGIGKKPSEFQSLPSAFLEAGAEHVIAAQWRIGEFATLIFVSKFYEAYAINGADPSAALRSAQNWVRRATVNELYQHVLTLVKNTNLSEQERLNLLSDASNLNGNIPPFSDPYFWAGFVHYHR